MSTFVWIVVSGTLMSALALALAGSLTLGLPERTFKRLILPMVSLPAGSLLGGGLFHMLPTSVDEVGNTLGVYVWLAAGSSRSSCSSSTCTGAAATGRSPATVPSVTSSSWPMARTTSSAGWPWAAPSSSTPTSGS